MEIEYASPRLIGASIALVGDFSSPSHIKALHALASLLAAGLRGRIGILNWDSQHRSLVRGQPIEALLANSQRAAGRLLGVDPAPRVVNKPPGIDLFTQQYPNVFTALDRDWIVQEGLIGRRLLIHLNPPSDLDIHATIHIADTCKIEETGVTFAMPNTLPGWRLVMVDILRTVITNQVLFGKTHSIFSPTDSK